MAGQTLYRRQEAVMKLEYIIALPIILFIIGCFLYSPVLGAGIIVQIFLMSIFGK